jgi:hypothetical protein
VKNPFERRSTGSLLASIAIHIAIVVALVNVVFRYPLGQLMGITQPEVNQERIQYVKLAPQPTENSAGGYTTAPPKAAAPAALQTPTFVPPTIPIAHPSDSSRAHAAGGDGEGLGASGSGLATGLVPRLPDPRITLQPGQMVRAPRTTAEDVDSIVGLAIGIVRDSIAIASGQRQPGDWTIKGKDGQKWGWDKEGIQLGKFTIPQALLAMLPLNVSSPMSPIEARSAAFIRRDVQENAQRAISEDEFKTAVKRIRERKEREKRQKVLASDSKGQPAQP